MLRAVPAITRQAASSVRRVKIRHLRLGDLEHLFAGDLANLVTVRLGTGCRDTGGFLQERAGGRRLGYECESLILVNRDDDRDDGPRDLLGRRVELLAELHDVYALLAECRADGRRRVRLTRRDLQLDHACNWFACHIPSLRALDLPVLQLDRRRTSEN